MMYTSATATAAELHAFGSVHAVVPRDQLREAAFALAAEVAAKNPAVIRMAKEAFNGIDLWDVRRSYRYEQGFTFELNLSGISDRLRESFGRPGSGQPGSGQPGSGLPGSGLAGSEPPARKD
jgi:enoyl-CoA hydratase